MAAPPDTNRIAGLQALLQPGARDHRCIAVLLRQLGEPGHGA